MQITVMLQRTVPAVDGEFALDCIDMKKMPHLRKEERENSKKTWKAIYGLLNIQAHGKIRKGKEAIQ